MLLSVAVCIPSFCPHICYRLSPAGAEQSAVLVRLFPQNSRLGSGSSSYRLRQGAILHPPRVRVALLLTMDPGFCSGAGVGA